MKTIYTTLLFLYFVAGILKAAPVSLEEFKRAEPMRRAELMMQAPPEQKAELQKLDMHLSLLQQYGGEERLTLARQHAVASARGLQGMANVFYVQSAVWDGYINDILLGTDKPGVSQKKLAELYKRLTDERNAVGKRILIVEAMVFKMAASAKALELDKKAQQLMAELSEKIGENGSHPHRPITKEEVMEMDKQMDQIFEEMKQLPTLPPEQLQKEYDAFPEANLFRKVT